MHLAFDAENYLVEGAHETTWPDFLGFFCAGPRQEPAWQGWVDSRKKLVLDHLVPLVVELSRSYGLQGFFIFGSFTDGHSRPQRVDVVIPIALGSPLCRYITANQNALESRYRIKIMPGVTNDRVDHGSYFQLKVTYQKREGGAQGIVVLDCS